MGKLCVQELLQFCQEHKLSTFIMDTGDSNTISRSATLVENIKLADAHVYSNNPKQFGLKSSSCIMKFLNVEYILLDELAPYGYEIKIACGASTNRFTSRQRCVYCLLAK